MSLLTRPDATGEWVPTIARPVDEFIAESDERLASRANVNRAKRNVQRALAKHRAASS